MRLFVSCILRNKEFIDNKVILEKVFFLIEINAFKIVID